MSQIRAVFSRVDAESHRASGAMSRESAQGFLRPVKGRKAAVSRSQRWSPGVAERVARRRASREKRSARMPLRTSPVYADGLGCWRVAVHWPVCGSQKRTAASRLAEADASTWPDGEKATSVT